MLNVQTRVLAYPSPALKKLKNRCRRGGCNMSYFLTWYGIGNPIFPISHSACKARDEMRYEALNPFFGLVWCSALLVVAGVHSACRLDKQKCKQQDDAFTCIFVA